VDVNSPTVRTIELTLRTIYIRKNKIKNRKKLSELFRTEFFIARRKPNKILVDFEDESRYHRRAEAKPMKESAEIIQFNKDEIAFDDIICVLNPLQSCDLKQILLMTHADRRMNVALAFANITLIDLANKSGLNDNNNTCNTVRRYLNYENKMPLGSAFRLAKVFGVSVEILFESSRYMKEGKYDYK